MKRNILDFSLEELSQLKELRKEKSFRVKQIFEWLHKKLVSSFSDMTNISKNLRDCLDEGYYIGGTSIELKLISKLDGTEKFLFTLVDNHQIEAVLMKYKNANTICISTQVGCRMGCTFCASTIDGVARNLTAGEMLSQVYMIAKLFDDRVSNIVLMGQGEPFDNYDNVIKFIHLVNDTLGLNISRRSITVSTCGLVPQIYKFADDTVSTTLAISLHAPNDKLRATMMPIANRYSIEQIMDAVDYYIKKTGRRITFEYSLVEEVNDDEATAKELAKLLTSMLCHVNLIPVNPVKERGYNRPRLDRIEKFKKILEKNHINVTIRREMGNDIAGACGQLRRSYKDNNNLGGDNGSMLKD